jgi:rare lipoprotein A (peptidoglycan hydrolase)
MRFSLHAIALFSLALVGIPVQARQVTATVYHPDFHGGPNYCDGTTYQHWGISAASSWLPCHSKVRVEHKGRVLTVYIKDRCASCDLDLSAGAAYRLGVPLDGIAQVRIYY